MDKYEVVETLGRGSFGKVTKIIRKKDQKEMVWKEIQYGILTEKEKTFLVSEVNILKNFRHPCIVRYYDRIIDRENKMIYIIMEICPSGDLQGYFKKLRSRNQYMNEELIWQMFTQIVLALHECHERKDGKVLHRDLKPANIFLDKKYNVKVGDFGLARVMGENSIFAKTNVGTPYYMSPELINEKAYNEKSDIWSLGCILYEMCCLKAPFQATNLPNLALKIGKGRYDPIPDRYSSDLKRLVRDLLSLQPYRRPGTSQLIKHPRIAQKIREYQINDQYNTIKKRMEEIKQREAAVEERERLVKEREIQVERREAALKRGSNERRFGQALDKENIPMQNNQFDSSYLNFKMAL